MVVDTDRLVTVQGADAEDQDPTGADQVRRRDDEVALQGCETSDRAGVEAPAGIGTSPQHAQPRTRGVEQDTVAARWTERRRGRVRHEREHAGRTEPGGVVGDQRHPPGSQVGRHHGGARRSETRRLAAGSCTQVRDELTGSSTHRVHDPLRRTVLHVAVGPGRDRRRLVHRREHRSGTHGSVVPGQQLEDPVRVGQLGGRVGVADRCGRHLPQDRVHQPPEPLRRRLDRGAHRSVVGDVVAQGELVGAEPQRTTCRRRRRRGEEPVDQVVE